MNSLYASLFALIVAVQTVTAAPSIKMDKSEVTGNSAYSDKILDVITSLKSNQAIRLNNSATNGTTDLVFAEVLEDMIIALKRIMPCGAPILDIPVLAPYRPDTIEFAIDKDFFKLNGKVENLVITGLNDILIINLATNTSTNRTTYDILYKDLQFLGDIDVHVDADLAGYRYVNHAHTLLNLQLQDIRYTVGITLGMNEIGGIKFTDLDYQVQVGDVISRNLNSNLTVATQNFANQFIHDASLLLLQTNRKYINEAASDYVTNTLNNILYELTISEFLNSIVQVTEWYNSIECSP